MNAGINFIVCSNGMKLKKYQSEWRQNWKINNHISSSKLLNGAETVESFLLRMDRFFGVTFMRIISFTSNNNVIKIKELYPEGGTDEAIVVFVKNRGSLCLLLRGARTLHEFLMLGHDAKGHSCVPLLLDDNLKPINL